MANKKDPPKKKYKDINKYLPDFSSAASATPTYSGGMLPMATVSSPMSESPIARNLRVKKALQEGRDVNTAKTAKEREFENTVKELSGAGSVERIYNNPKKTTVGTAKALANIATLPVGLGQGLSEVVRGKKFDMGNNPLTGGKYSEGFNEALDVATVLPALGLVGKGLGASKKLNASRGLIGKGIQTSKESGVLSNTYKKNNALMQNTNELAPPPHEIILDEHTVNLERLTPKSKRKMMSFDDSDIGGGLTLRNNPSRVKNTEDILGKKRSIKSVMDKKTGESIDLKTWKDDDGQLYYYMSANMPSSKIKAGKAYLEIEKHIPKGASLLEDSSLSYDSFLNIIKQTKNPKFETFVKGNVPMNNSAKNASFKVKPRETAPLVEFANKNHADDAVNELNLLLDKYNLPKATVINEYGNYSIQLPNIGLKKLYSIIGMGGTGAYTQTQDNSKQQFGKGGPKPGELYNTDRANELGYTFDELGHLPSVDSETGMWLKSKEHPTAWKELNAYALNLDLQRQLKHPVVNPEGYFGDNQLQYNAKEQYATGGLINNNNNNMIKEFNGDLHSNPSEGIKYGNILVEDGELEHNGYIFSKDANETKEAKKQMNKRSLRTDENGYIWDGISRKSLEPKMKNLAMSHERNRLSEEYDNMAQNEMAMYNDTMSIDGMQKYATGGFNDMPVNTPQMITNQQPVNNFGGGLNASSNFRPDARFSPGFKPSSDPSIANPQRYSGNISGGKKGGSGMSAGEAAGYAAAAGNLASTLGELGSDDPYAKVGLGEKDQGTQIAESSTDTVVSAIPFVGQWYGAGKGLSSGAEAVRDEARAQGEDEAAQAWAYMGGTIDPMGSWFDLKSDLDKGVEGTTGAAIANVFLPGLGDAIMEPNRRRWAEQQKKKQENKLFLENRDYGGTEMDEVAIRDRQTAGKGGPRMMYENGGSKPKLNAAKLNFNFKPSITSPSSDPSVAYPYKYMPPTENPSSIYKTDVPDIESQNDAWSQRQRANAIKENPEILSLFPESKPSYSVSGTATGPNTPMSMIGSDGKNKVDWGNIAETAGMGLLSNVGNLAYLLGEGKDYDKVNYGVYNPDMVNSSSSRRAIRDSIATAREGLKESGRLDRASMAMLGIQGGKQLADAEERIRLANIGMLNDAQMKNIELGRLGQDATAQNKGVALSNYYAALSGIGENMQNAYGNYNLRNADAERVAQNKIKNDWISRQMELTFGKNS